MSMKEKASHFMEQDGLFQKGLKMSKNQTVSYVKDFGRTTKFLVKTAIVLAAFGGGYLVNNTVWDTNGPKLDFTGDVFSLVSVDEGKVTVEDQNGNQTSFIQAGDTWVDLQMNPTSLGGFLDRCLVYSKLAKESDELDRPQYITSNWVPTVVMPEAEDLEDNPEDSEVEQTDDF